MSAPLSILCVGDIVGSPGRAALRRYLPELQKEHAIDVTIVNIENAAGGFGVTAKVMQEVSGLNIHAFTSGNHIYDKREFMSKMGLYPNLIRPLNFSPGAPGTGIYTFTFKGHTISIVNLIGRIFMNDSDCPFRTIHAQLDALRDRSPIILVDFHAEATSEKQAMGWFLSQKVSAVYGTHTHVRTADFNLLDDHTAYVSDIGMTGAKNGILGMSRDSVIQKFITQLPARFEPCDKPPFMINAIKVVVDPDSGKALSIEPIYREGF